METRELTDMTAVLRSINDGNPSNAERWVTLTQRVVRADAEHGEGEKAMDAPMTPREAVAWLLENTAATRKTYCIILRSTNGVHNPGTRGMLICQAAELAGRLHAYRESLHHMMQAGMIPADLLDDVKEVLK